MHPTLSQIYDKLNAAQVAADEAAMAAGCMLGAAMVSPADVLNAQELGIYESRAI